MFDFKAYFQIVQDVAIATAKSIHKPSLNSKESMTAYAKAIGSYGKKASFTMEQKANNMLVEW